MGFVGAVSFSVCAMAFAALAVLLAVGRRGQGLAGARLTFFLIAACLATAVWAGVIGYNLYAGDVPPTWVRLAEVARSGLWIVFILQLLQGMGGGVGQRAIRLAGYLVPAGVLLGEIWAMFTAGPEGMRGNLVKGFVLGALVQAIAALMLLEQFYRNLDPERRWAMKHMALGLAVMFAFDVYLYTDALLTRGIDATAWAARGAVDALAVPLVALTVSRHRSWSQHLFVSRDVAFHTATLIAAGGYLIVMALGGYYIRALDGTWGGFAQVVFLVASLVGLLLVVLSRDVRTRLRVFLVKHFFSNKYDYRVEWLRLIRALTDSSDRSPPPERAVKAVAQIFDSPGGAVWVLRDGRAFVPVGAWRLQLDAEAVLEKEAALCAFMRDNQWVVDLDEYRNNPQRYNALPLPEWLAAIDRGWIILPLLQNDELYGFMLLLRPDVPTEITWEDRDLLKTLGRQVAIYVDQHESAVALSQARQFEAFNRLTAFIMHDLKNLMAQQSLVVRNAEKHKHNPEFVDDAMQTIRESVARMHQLLEHLQRGRQAESVERVRVSQLLSDLARRCGQRHPAPKVVNTLDGEYWIEAAPDGLSMVLVHIVRNAQDATDSDGRVDVRVMPADEGVMVEVEDNGSGMDEAFIRDRLFRPFDTTKSAKGMGIGAYQAREFVRDLGGDVSVQSTPGVGTLFQVRLPATRAATWDDQPSEGDQWAQTNS